MENKEFRKKISKKGEEYFVNTERFTITKWDFEKEEEEDVVFIDDIIIDEALKFFNSDGNNLVRIENKYYEILGDRNSDFILRREAFLKFEIVDEVTVLYSLKSNIHGFLLDFPELEESILSLAKDIGGYYIFIYDDPTKLSPYDYIIKLVEELEDKTGNYEILKQFERLFHNDYIPSEVGILGD